MRAKVALGILTLAGLFAVATSRAAAQELEPRAYANLPVGLNFLGLTYGFSTGEVLTDPALPLRDVEASIHGGLASYLRALGIAGRSAKIYVGIPVAGISASGDLAGAAVSRDVTGLADPILGFTINLYGAPALPPDEFRSYVQDLNIGLSLAVRPPLGRDDEDRLVNPGTNRWAVRPEIGLSKALGRWTIEASASITIFSDNRDFLGDQVREQDPVHALQVHAIYTFPSTVWIGLSATYFAGGEVQNRGPSGEVTRLRGPRNSRLGLTVSVPIDRRSSVVLRASTSITTRAGGRFDQILVTWQYRFGAGV